MRILPYRTMKGTIGGLVLTFLDITQTRQAETILASGRDYFQDIVNTVRQPLAVLDAELRIVSSNRAFYRTFDLLPSDVEGRVPREVAGGAWSTPVLREQVERVLPTRSTFEGIEVDAPRAGLKRLLVNGRQLEQEIGLPGRILLVMEERSNAG
jgi:two-component system CheB/CheR fusion protein